jgi:antitoxin PrlF
MIHSRITAKAQTTVPLPVRRALGLEAGDDLVWNIEGGSVILTRAAKAADPFVNNFATFSEWASDADCKAFDHR